MSSPMRLAQHGRSGYFSRRPQVKSESSCNTGRLAMASTDASAIERELDRIRLLGLEELRLECRLLYHDEPPKISRDLLTLALGYRLQEIEHGGLGKAT